MLGTRRQLLGLPLLALLVGCRPRDVGDSNVGAIPPAATSTAPIPVVSPTAIARSVATPTARPDPTATPTVLAEPTPTITPAVESGEMPKVEIALDQVGYRPELGKIATIFVGDSSGHPMPAQFQIVANDQDSWVLIGEIRGPNPEPESGGRLAWQADFSALKAEGSYRVRVPNAGDSPLFTVASSIYADVFGKALRSYYLNRCGVSVDDWVTGVRHDVCHLAQAAFEDNPGTKLDVRGGWHDAGDYGRYVPTAAVTIGQLLLLAELVPKATRVSLSGTDLLAEARYELDWLLRMQRADGGVYHKVSSANFPGFVRPEEDQAPLLVYGVGSADTGAAAAAFARGARAFTSDRSYAQLLGDAATRAWGWLQDHPQHVVPPVGGTGPYLTGDDGDTREWAAAELFALTGESSYEQYLKGRPRSWVGPVSWADTSGLALVTYALTPSASTDARIHAVQTIVNQAKERVTNAQSHPYGVALRPDEYTWASAKSALAMAQVMLLANKLAPAPSFVTMAANQLHWALGRNPLGQSFVTGVGTRAPLHPHHRLIAAGGKMIPGLLVGGPNGRVEDGRAPANLGPRSYVDDQEAYSCNEPAIDYNAPLVFVAGWLAYGAT
jgi:endoglucanase